MQLIEIINIILPIATGLSAYFVGANMRKKNEESKDLENLKSKLDIYNDIVNDLKTQLKEVKAELKEVHKEFREYRNRNKK